MQLRKHPGITVTELASALDVTGMGVRRHLECLEADGLVEHSESTDPSVAHPRGRPPTGWQLSAAGIELFPRRYEALALDILDSLAEGDDSQVALSKVFAGCTEKTASEYSEALAAKTEFTERVEGLARLRDDAGYLAEVEESPDGTMLLTENNCAVHRVAQRWPAVCAMELSLLQRVLGPEVEVTRVAHTMSGDPVCSYRIRRLA